VKAEKFFFADLQKKVIQFIIVKDFKPQTQRCTTL